MRFQRMRRPFFYAVGHYNITCITLCKALHANGMGWIDPVCRGAPVRGWYFHRLVDRSAAAARYSGRACMLYRV